MIHFLTEEEKKQVSHAVAAAERTTSGEIIPMIVRRSTAVGHVRAQVFSLLLIFILLCRIALDGFFHGLPLEWITLGGIVLAIPLSFWFKKFTFVQRAMTPHEDLEFEVFERAKLEFYESNIHKAKSDAGVLIFISLMERQCVVLAGESISKKMPKETWQEVVRLAIQGIKDKKAADGLSAAIKLCGNILTQHYPTQPGDENELPDTLIIKE